MGKTLNGMLRTMNIPKSGGRSGQSTLAREQLNRLCATTFTSTHYKEKLGKNVVIADDWMTASSDGVAVKLSERFHKLAIETAVPLDMHIVSRVAPLAARARPLRVAHPPDVLPEGADERTLALPHGAVRVRIPAHPTVQVAARKVPRTSTGSVAVARRGGHAEVIAHPSLPAVRGNSLRTPAREALGQSSPSAGSVTLFLDEIQRWFCDAVALVL